MALGDLDPAVLQRAADTAAAQVDGIALVTLSGSRAYGTNRPGSDLDLAGVYVAPTRDVLSLQGAKKTHKLPDRDATFHEMSHFCKLAAAANPTILEVLWSPVLVMGEHGKRLRATRQAFLSKRVVNTYGGYAVSQLRKAEAGTGGARGVEHFKREKFLMHTLRLLDTGIAVLRTGEVPVQVPDPDALWERARRTFAEVRVEAEGLLLTLDKEAATSRLPEEPAWGAINRMIYDIRLSRTATQVSD